MEITKVIWDSWKKTEKRKMKNGDRLVLEKNTGRWVKVWWRN